MPPKRKFVDEDDSSSNNNSSNNINNNSNSSNSSNSSNNSNSDNSTSAATTATATPKSTSTTSTTTSSKVYKTILDIKNNISLPITNEKKLIQWKFQESEFEWKQFDNSLLLGIEEAYQLNPKDISERFFGSDNEIVVIFAEMKMYSNEKSSPSFMKKKNIKRVICQPVWSWEKSRAEFSAFIPDVSRKIEFALLHSLTNYTLDTERYIKFSTYEQCRFDDSTKTRRVKRSYIEITDLHNPSWYYQSSCKTKWELYSDSDDIEKSFQYFVENGKNTFYKNSDDEYICFLTNTSSKKLGSSGTLVKRDSGPITAIKKTYSNMSEEEKKAMINSMLSGSVKAASNDNKKLKVDTSASTSTGLYLPGEEDILKGSKVMKYILRPQRSFDSSVADLHYRVAESQFARLLSSGTSYKVSKVEYIVNPDLTKKFNKKMEEFKKLGYPDSNSILAFHGTAAKNIIPICKNNFSVPGSNGVQHATDSGWYGKGIYFSEYPDYSIGYIKDCTKILLCKVLLGKSYKCTKLITGQPCQTGYTSHLSPDEKELVLFHPDQILPIYCVHYVNGYAGVSTPSSETVKLYNQASATATSNVLNGMVIGFAGNLATTHYTLQTLVNKHGASYINHASNVVGCSYLITTKSDYASNSSKVSSAKLLKVPIVSEEWLYKTIITNKIKKADAYGFDESKKVKISNDTIKPIPLEQLDYDDVDEDEDEDEDDKKDKKPPCKYGTKCYRKSADHFKEFDHDWLVD